MLFRFAVHLVLLLAALVGSAYSRADLIVSRSIVELAQGETRADVVLINSDEEATLYVQVDPFQVQAAGEVSQELLPITAADNHGLLVSPNRLAIPPGGRSLVRMLNLTPDAAEERIYRINLIPIPPPVEIDPPEGNAVRSALEVVVAYQVLLMIRPEDPQPVQQYERSGQQARFGNPGNSNYLLTDGQQCNPEDAEDCRQLPDHRMYAGNVWQLDLPFDAPFSYSVRTQEGISAHRFE